MIIVLNQKEEGAKDYILESYPRMSRVSDGYHGCKLCKPHKAQGNSEQAIKAKYRKLLYGL